MARIYDNIDITFEQGLKDIISNQGVTHVDFCVGYFNLRGWEIIANEIDRLTGEYVFEGDERILRHCRLLIGMHRPPKEVIEELYPYSAETKSVDSEIAQRARRKIAVEFREQLMLGAPSARAEWALRRLSAQLKEKRVALKLYLRHPLHAKLYLAHRPGDHFNKIQAIMGSSNLTYSGLSREGELNAEFGDSDSAEKLARWFEKRWEDYFCIDISADLIEVIDSSWASEVHIPPYHIYLKAVYHLCEDVRAGWKEFDLPFDLERDLFDFQVTAVKLAARRLDKVDGAMIGDVVGLGKTITACAIAKVYEKRNACSTLIVCPPNLQPMWNKYVRQYDLKADVVSIAQKLDYESIKYYKLVIVDESHNLRNNLRSRYANIKELIEHQSPKVLLLSATPYNKDYSDLSNQLKLFVGEEDDLGIQPDRYLKAINGVREFNKLHPDVPLRSIKAFEKSTYVEDWRELMRLYLVRRTRTFIKENYAIHDPIKNRYYLEFREGRRMYFPERKAKSLKFKTTPDDMFERMYSEKMVDWLKSLRLPRYGLKNHIDATVRQSASNHETQILDNLSRAGTRMIGFCRCNFYKRMDSSGFAFLLSLYRHVLRNVIFLYALDHHLPLPIGDEGSLPDPMNDNDTDATEDSDTVFTFPCDMAYYEQQAKEQYDRIIADNRVTWVAPTFFKGTLKTELRKDNATLLKMIVHCGTWLAEQDEKLNTLEHLLRQTHPKEKVLVFTQYSDTARYIGRQLKRRNFSDSEYITGDSENILTVVERFSPVSNKVNSMPSVEHQVRVLVTTDVLSEGQNLQDAHIIVNFDMPWAIIRLIQRAGRVDRIGQTAEDVFCYSFFPQDGINKVIRLHERLKERMNTAADLLDSDELFFEGNEQTLRNLYNEKSGVLDEADTEEVDIQSQAFQIWKTATEADPSLKESIPKLANVIYSTKAPEGTEHRLGVPGIITYARTTADNNVLTWMDLDKNIITQSQHAILQAMACSANEPPCKPLAEHHEIVAESVRQIRQEKALTSGTLGSRSSTKYRLFTLLDGYCKEERDTLFVTDELRFAVDEIYNYPIRDNAKYLLGQMLKRGRSVQEIAKEVVDLRKRNELCVVTDDDTPSKDPHIICSMGLRGKP